MLFQKGPEAERAAASRWLKALARTLFDAEEGDAVVVSELQCTEPGCPPIETVLALLRPDRNYRQVKIHKALLDVVESDVRHAFLAHEHARSDG